MEFENNNPEQFKSINEECEYYKKHSQIIEKQLISLQKDLSKLVEEKKELLLVIEKQKTQLKELEKKLSSSGENNSNTINSINNNSDLNTLESESDLNKKIELTENNDDVNFCSDYNTLTSNNGTEEINEHPELYEGFHKDLYEKEEIDTIKERLTITQLNLNNSNPINEETDNKDVNNKKDEIEDKIAIQDQENDFNIIQEIINKDGNKNTKISEEEEQLKTIENYLSVNFINFSKDILEFRKIIFENEDKINRLCSILKRWYHFSKIFKKAIHTLEVASKNLNDNLIPNKETIFFDCPDLLSKIYLLQKILGDVSTYCSFLINSIDSNCNKEIEKNVKKYFGGFKKQRLNFSKKYSEFIDLQTKYLNTKKTKKDFNTLKENYYKKYVELLEYKYDYICMINQISMFSRLKLPEIVSLLNFSIVSFFTQFYDENKNIPNFVSDNLEKMLTKIKVKNQIVEKMVKQRKDMSNIFKYVDNSLITKEGFLNMKNSMGIFKRKYIKFEKGNIVNCKLSKYSEKDDNNKVNSHLNYIEKINPGETTVICSLLFCNVKQCDKNYNYPFCFEIINAKNQKTFIFQAETEYEAQEWIYTIQNAIGNQIILLNDINEIGSKTERHSIKERKSLSAENKKYVKDEKNNEIKTNNNKDIKNEKQNNESKIYIELLININKCVDCEEKKPTWLNTNWLTLNCIECSGIHRNLGVQISKIRSLQLDNISKEYIELLCAIKQDSINSVLEEELTNNIVKPNPITSREQKEKFIIEKYKEKRFIKNSKIENIELVIFEAIQNNELIKVYKLLKTNDVDINGLYKINDEEYGFAHHCAKLGKLTLIKLFYVLGTDVNKKDSKGLKPFDYAEKNKQKEVREYLETKEK